MQKMSGQIRLTRIERGESLELVRLPTSTLKAGDRLHFRGSPEDIKATPPTSNWLKWSLPGTHRCTAGD
jgi:hypothetical protein